MVKVIVDWERSGSGSGMATTLLQGRNTNDEDDSIGNSENVQSECDVYEFWDGDDRKSFYEKDHPIYYIYGTWHTNMTF